MQLPGRLRGTTLGDVLGTLHRARATGILELVEAGGPGSGRSHRICLEGGLVASVETPLQSSRLGEILQEQGYLRGGISYRIAAVSRQRSQAVGKLLLEHRLVSVEQISSALREQVRRRLEKLFRIDDAFVRFHVPRPLQGDSTRPKPLSAREFLHGRRRARDGSHSWNESVRARSAPPSRPVESPLARAFGVLGLRDGASQDEVRRAFRRLASESHPDRFPHATEAERRGLMRRLSALTAAYHELLAHDAVA